MRKDTGLHLHAFDQAGDEEVDRVDGYLFGFGGRGRCGCLCGFGQGVDDGGHGAVVGGQAGSPGKEPLRAQRLVGFEVDAVDREEVRVDVIAVLDDPGVVC
jgi:hypothetical protein